MKKGAFDVILEMADGQVRQMAERELRKVVENLMDPAYDAAAKRKVQISLEITPLGGGAVRIKAGAKTTLAPPEPVKGSIAMVPDGGTGELVFVDMDRQIPGQERIGE